VSALLAGEFHPRCALFGRDPVRRTAFAAYRLDAGIALLNDKVFAFHGFADQPLGLFPHFLLRHPLNPALKNANETALYHGIAPCEQGRMSFFVSLIGSDCIKIAALISFDAFSLREPASTSLENALL
jgi:hypothetical protein